MEQNVQIVELNAENWYDCCELEVSPEQKKFMESNAISIAQSKFEPTLKPYAIYDNEKVVGFLMYNSVQEELDGYWIYRIMVDKTFQGKGIGKVATTLMLSEMAKLPNAKKIIVGYHPENLEAHHLYTSLGFMDEGDRFGKEMAVIKIVE
ncbi:MULTISPECIES: GNAT family N-acetyltransferase [Lysinibacillus]|uniref:GNAT family N-acetyltransferase n=1 Tax=Lysinibacillus varians TaxID=1145276 RepID=A0ABY2T6A8_9BACI|nr:GNAT family N-acetyltransferase [Lysinibacillus varians]AHN21147.1 spermidine acetyltransferase [Lysinibacillus varians]TKI59561.1 GNAT family N-acetyltransferase [Lysinibacillus varians]